VGNDKARGPPYLAILSPAINIGLYLRPYQSEIGRDQRVTKQRHPPPCPLSPVTIVPTVILKRGEGREGKPVGGVEGR